MLLIIKPEHSLHDRLHQCFCNRTIGTDALPRPPAKDIKAMHVYCEVASCQSDAVAQGFFEPAEVVGSAPWSERSVLSIVGSTNFLLSLIWNNVAQVRCNSKDPCTRAARAPPKCTHMLAAEQYNNNCSSLTIHLRCPQHRSEPLKPRRTITMMPSRLHHRLGRSGLHQIGSCNVRLTEKLRV